MSDPGAPIRRVTVDDEAAVVALCERIWPGSDHVPYYFARYLASPGTVAHAIAIEGRIAALAFLDLDEEAGWWHSVRVDPAHRGCGLARRLLDHHVAACRRVGRVRLRCATTTSNEAVHRLAARAGLVRLGTWRSIGAGGAGPPLDGQRDEKVRPLVSDDGDRAWSLIASSAAFRGGDRTYCRLGHWHTLDPSLLRMLIELGGAFGYVEGGAIKGLALATIDHEPGYTWFFLGLVEGTPRAITALGRYLRRLVPSIAPDSDEEHPLRGMVRSDPVACEALAAAGFCFDPDDDMDVLERRI